ncbi:MAG: molybdenum ABC transporter ATP-binding protein [Bauldia sp.]
MADPAAADGGLHVRLTQDAPMSLAVAFSAAPGTVVALVGPSGSGKTSTLRAIAGFMRPAAGYVSCGGEVWLDTTAGIDVGARRRRAGFVVQAYALFPHLSAVENVMAGLIDRPAAARREEAHALLARVHLSGIDDRKPSELSGGQQQRIAVARALARQPRVLLLDEPFSAVDQPTRQRLQAEMVELRGELPMPVVLVTHNVDEVARLADSLVLLADGKTVASGTVNEVFGRFDLRPHTGHFETSMVLHAPIGAHDPSTGTTFLDHPAGRLSVGLMAAAPGSMARIRVRARDVALAVGEPGRLSIRNRLRATVSEIAEGEGQAVDVRLDVGGETLIASITREAVRALDLKVGQPVVALIKSMALDRPGDFG